MLKSVSCSFAVGFSLFAFGGVPAFAWEPSGPVTLVVPYAAGGGTDQVFRVLTQVINNNNLSSANWIVENRDGGGGMTGMRHVINQSRDEHLLVALTPGHLMVPKLQNLPLSWEQLTPIANLVIDPQVLVTNTESQYQSIDVLADALRSDTEQPRMAGGVVGQDDHLTSVILDLAIGKRSNYISFTGGGELRQALMGGHVDAGWLNPSEMRGMTPEDGGNIIPLAVALDTRIDALPDVPTFQEHGLDVVYDLFFRALAAPGDIPQEVADYYIGVVEAAVNEPAWLEFVEASGTVSDLRFGEEAGAAFAAWDARLEELVPEVMSTQN